MIHPSILDRNLLQQVDFNRKIAQIHFFRTECQKCAKMQLMKTRDCDLLYGYPLPCCKLMDEFVEKQNEEINKKILEKALLPLLASISNGA